MNTKKILFFGGSGGLGKKIIPLMTDYEIISIGSRDVDLSSTEDIITFFSNLEKFEVLIIFSNFNFNSFLHKYETSSLNLQKQLDVNIRGNLQVIIESLKIMRKNNYGKIIIASSVTVDNPVVGTSIYSSCKSFFENMVKTIALENSSKNITANCIQLGYMDGGLLYTLSNEFLEKIKNDIPTKRFGTIEEIVQTLRFLLNNDYINGQTIKLTGGL